VAETLAAILYLQLSTEGMSHCSIEKLQLPCTIFQYG